MKKLLVLSLLVMPCSAFAAIGLIFLSAGVAFAGTVLTQPGFQQDIRSFGAKCDGVTDDTTAANAAFAWSAAAQQRIMVPPNCFSATGFIVPVNAVVQGAIIPTVPGSGGFVGSSLVCGAGVTQCVTVDGHANSNGGSTAEFRNLIISGTLNGGVYSGKGLYYLDGFNARVNNVFITGFGDCLYFKNDNNPSHGGLTAYIADLTISACAHSFLTDDGWPEIKITRARFGMTNDVTGTDSYLLFTGGFGGTAAAPNTFVCSVCQFNASNSPTYWQHYKTIPSGTDLGASTFADNTLDSTGGGMASLIRVDSDVNTPIKGLTIHDTYFNTPGVKFLDYQSTQQDTAWDIHDNTMFLNEAVWSWPAVQHSSLRFHHNYINFGTAGTMTVTTASGGRADFSNNRVDEGATPYAILHGNWQNFDQCGGGELFFGTDDATGVIHYCGLPHNWTPVLKYGATAATLSGTAVSATRTAEGNLTYYFIFTVSNLNGGTGNAVVSGAPYACSQQAQGTLILSVGGTALPMVQASNSTPGTFNLIGFTGGNAAALTDTTIPVGTTMIGTVTCPVS